MTTPNKNINSQDQLALHIKNSAKSPVVLIFTAKWISQSSIVEIVASKIEIAAPEAAVIIFDADEHEDTFVQYKVGELPTAIIIKNHKLEGKIVGTFSKKAVLDVIMDI